MTTKSKTETAQPGEAARQISVKASAEISNLHATLQQLREEHIALSSEREQVQAGRAFRVDHLTQLHTGVDKLITTHRDALSYASVAVGTAGESKSIHAVSQAEQAIEPARLHAERKTTEYRDLDTAATERLQEIDERLDRIASLTAEARSRLMDVERVRDRSVAELAQHTYDGLMEEYQVYQDRIDELKLEMITIQVERVQFLERASATLQPWPDVHLKFTFVATPGVERSVAERQYNDPTYRVLQSALNYIDVLLQDGKYLPTQLSQKVPEANQWGANWLNVLEISHDVLFYEGLGGHMIRLNAHRRSLDNLINQYVAAKL